MLALIDAHIMLFVLIVSVASLLLLISDYLEQRARDKAAGLHRKWLHRITKGRYKDDSTD